MDDLSSHATSSKSLSIENVIPLAKSSLPVLSEEEHSHAMSSTNVMPEKPAITFANQTKPSIPAAPSLGHEAKLSKPLNTENATPVAKRTIPALPEEAHSQAIPSLPNAHYIKIPVDNAEKHI
jgi:hypothetical protein